MTNEDFIKFYKSKLPEYTVVKTQELRQVLSALLRLIKEKIPEAGVSSHIDLIGKNDEIDFQHLTAAQVADLHKLQVGDGVTITGSGTILDPFVAQIPEIDSSLWEQSPYIDGIPDTTHIQPKDGKRIYASIIDNLPTGGSTTQQFIASKIGRTNTVLSAEYPIDKERTVKGYRLSSTVSDFECIINGVTYTKVDITDVVILVGQSIIINDITINAGEESGSIVLILE